MGCTSSKGKDVSGSRLGSDMSVHNPMENVGERWRLEPLKALNHFLNSTGEELFGGDTSLFDYFQDDEFVELRALLDEPLGRSHFLAHVERYFPDDADLVRLWLLLHHYHHLDSDDAERFRAAKSLYRNYFQISQVDKADAEDFRQTHKIELTQSMAPGSEQGEARRAEVEAEEFRKYHMMLVPERCRGFSHMVIAIIIKIRPAVELALMRTRERFNSDESQVDPNLRNVRQYSSSIGNFVDISPPGGIGVVDIAVLTTLRESCMQQDQLGSARGLEVNANSPLSASSPANRLLGAEQEASADDGAAAQTSSDQAIEARPDGAVAHEEPSADGTVAHEEPSADGAAAQSVAGESAEVAAGVQSDATLASTDATSGDGGAPAENGGAAAAAPAEKGGAAAAAEGAAATSTDGHLDNALASALAENNSADGAAPAQRKAPKFEEMKEQNGVLREAVEILGADIDAEKMPPLNLFMDLQNEVFKGMKPLYHHFKETSEDYEAYKKSRRVVYNHVEPRDFKYIDILGKGGFGQVVHVIKRSTGQHYAMKVQAKDTLIETWGGKMQHVEIERDVLVANRSFPFIVSLRYAFQDDKYAFLCLDLAENGSLRQVLEAAPGFQLPAVQLRLYVAEIVLALECLHNHDIIYRDLKPENVLLCADGHIMLADMGLAAFYYQDKYNDADRAIGEGGVVGNARAEIEDEDNDLFDDSDTVSRVESSAVSSICGNSDGGLTGTSSEHKGNSEAGDDGAETDCADDEHEGYNDAHDNRGMPKYTRAKTIKSHDTDCGTPMYRPPEMIKSGHYNEGVDWFMLGVFTYECLLGHLPFEPRADKISDSGMINIETDEDELRLLRKKVVIPPHLDMNTRDFLTGLLDLDPTMRLGVGPEELKRDLGSLKDHGFFVPLAGPLATSMSWEKVMRKEYSPIFVPEVKELDEKSHFSNFEALVKSWKRRAKKEAQEYARRHKVKTNYKIQILQEGKPIDKSLEHYFDNWDYIDPESINLEKEAEQEGIMRTPSMAASIRADFSRSFKNVRERIKLKYKQIDLPGASEADSPPK